MVKPKLFNPTQTEVEEAAKRLVEESLRKSPDQMYKERVISIKDKLPKNFRQIIYDTFPEYNTAKGAILINNVVVGRSPDVRLTEILLQNTL